MLELSLGKLRWKTNGEASSSQGDGCNENVLIGINTGKLSKDIRLWFRYSVKSQQKIVWEALLLLHMMKDLLDKIEQHLCHMKNQSVKCSCVHTKWCFNARLIHDHKNLVAVYFIYNYDDVNGILTSNPVQKLVMQRGFSRQPGGVNKIF